MHMAVVLFLLVLTFPAVRSTATERNEPMRLRFRQNGQFKILQVADMHFGNGKATPCEDVLPTQLASCSDLNTTAFLRRIILAEKPDLIVFTGIFLLLIFFFFLCFWWKLPSFFPSISFIFSISLQIKTFHMRKFDSEFDYHVKGFESSNNSVIVCLPQKQKIEKKKQKT